MAVAEGVADFVGGELADSEKGHLQGFGGVFLVFLICADHTFGDEEILADALGAEGDSSFDDFAGAGVCDGPTGGPAASGAVDPVDDVIANVPRVGVFGEQFDLEGVAVADGFEGLVPPAAAFEEGGADGLGGAAIDVIDDRLDGIADFGVGVFLL